MHRRIFKGLVPILLLGALSTVLAAWVCAMDLVKGIEPMRPARAPDFPAVRVWRRDAMGQSALVARPAAQGPSTPGDDRDPEFDEIAPAWARHELLDWARGDADPGPTEWDARAMVITGWPARSMWASFDLQPSSGYWWYQARNGIRIAPAPAEPDPFASLSPRERVLPMRVAPWGFAVSTAFWGAGWAGLLMSAPAVRRVLRRRRGCCEGCGYDRRGLGGGAVCPECGRGAEVQKRLESKSPIR